MTQRPFHIFLIATVLGLACFSAIAAPLRFEGEAEYEIDGNTVSVSVDRIRNTSTRQTSGNVLMHLIATDGPNPFERFHRLASFSLEDDVGDGGRIPPSSVVTSVQVFAPFIKPPEGVYYVHLLISETSNKAGNANEGGEPTAGLADFYTFDELLKVGPPARDSVTGIYFDQQTPGQGFSVLVNSRGMTVFFFGHTASGERLWLISEQGPATVQSGNPLVLEMHEVVSGVFGAPDHGSLQVWGTIEVSFGDPCNPSGSSAQLQGIDGTQSLVLTQLAGVPEPSCQKR